ncbi:MerR family transcriptional regulator [Sediminibacillus massiliensis]|uniref:MerR family transcriptional regulator n=1 Tax=Sediminibacillus massiliensis TaxID=1926277 RepID=UPI0015C2F51E|nr:MerR family transcriptional regulator [Sediminibacillus massiliensis]
MLRIGELAEACHVSKRTIDYYTRLGLLNCRRSDSNYRLYDQESVSDLRFIIQCKNNNMTLDEIKNRLILRKSDEIKQEEVHIQVEVIANKIEFLQAEVEELYAAVKKMNEKDQKVLFGNIKPETAAFLQSLISNTTQDIITI